MSLLNFFRIRRASSASVAKERLQILVAHEHGQHRTSHSYLPIMQEELLAVISKYVNINRDDLKVTLEQNEHEEILELNIVLPDENPPTIETNSQNG